MQPTQPSIHSTIAHLRPTHHDHFFLNKLQWFIYSNQSYHLTTTAFKICRWLKWQDGIWWDRTTVSWIRIDLGLQLSPLSTGGCCSCATLPLNRSDRNHQQLITAFRFHWIIIWWMQPLMVVVNIAVEHTVCVHSSEQDLRLCRMRGFCGSHNLLLCLKKT